MVVHRVVFQNVSPCLLLTLISLDLSYIYHTLHCVSFLPILWAHPSHSPYSFASTMKRHAKKHNFSIYGKVTKANISISGSEQSWSKTILPIKMFCIQHHSRHVWKSHISSMQEAIRKGDTHYKTNNAEKLISVSSGW